MRRSPMPADRPARRGAFGRRSRPPFPPAPRGASAPSTVATRGERGAADPSTPPGSIVTFDPPLTRDERRLLEHIPFVVDLSGSRVSWQGGAARGGGAAAGGALPPR